MRLVLYAVSTPHASELLETVARLRWELAAAVRNLPDRPVPLEFDDITELDQLNSELLGLPFAVPQTNPDQRRKATADARAHGFAQAVTLSDPTATVAASAGLGEGCYVGAGSVVGAGARLGEGTLVNRSCSVAHHVTFGPFATTGPGVVIAGGCRIEAEAFIGTGAVLAPELQIGPGAVVGAGAVVIRDVAPGEVVVGNPARPLARH